MQSFLKKMLFAVETQRSKPVKLIIRAVRAFKMGIFFRMIFVILDQSAAKSRNQFTQVSDLYPRLHAEFFSVVDGEYDLGRDTIGFQPILSTALQKSHTQTP
jgi:hypothetical protein